MKRSTGRGWAYVTMLAMLALSIAGNIAHTEHINPSPSTRQYVYAIMWPLMVWAGVELFVRVQWREQLTDKLVRWVGITLVASIAALVSYRHLRGLLLADGEEWTVYTFGPLAVDGLMLMATLALLLTRQLPASLPKPLTAPASATVPSVQEQIDGLALADMLPQPVSPGAPFVWTQAHGEAVRSGGAVLDDGMTQSAEQVAKERKPRAASSGTTEQMVRELLSGERKPASSTERRYATVIRKLRDDANADITEKVRPELLDMMRAELRMERAR